ncbi:hypothetical protein GCM10010387_29350 [Streptomyces inusitatus]|uniref:Leucine rich repeat variant n=1 Tax=Streptomyces inusitatus TaxID=68221 RepID=A0A918Q765_9ACTN|nr:hypothetical protein GCM10010387_29350 [Streptomyces inusitatus]
MDRLIAVADADLADSLAGREELSHAQARALAARDEDLAVRLAHEGRLTAADIDPTARPLAALALLDRGEGPLEWARSFAGSPVVEHREKLAACPGLPDDVVTALAADPDIAVVAELALWAGPEQADRLARHPHAEVRSAAAANENTPPAALAALLTGEGMPPARHCLVCDREPIPFVHDPHCPRRDCSLPGGAACDGTHQSTVHTTHIRALANPATPAEAAARFADHPSTLLRWMLAARPDLPPALGERLADDPSPGVRADLAANPAIGEPLMRRLAASGDREVRRALARHPRVPLDLLAELADADAAGSGSGAEPPPRIAAAPPAELREPARSSRPGPRRLLARRRDLPAGTRDALAADPDAKVAAAIASHPGLSEDRLRSLLHRHGARVAAGVAANPDTPPALLEELARWEPRARRALLAAARHPSLPPRTVTVLLADDDHEVAEAAAAHPGLPPAVMAELVTNRVADHLSPTRPS